MTRLRGPFRCAARRWEWNRRARDDGVKDMAYRFLVLL
jgi:hypothetical protein